MKFFLLSIFYIGLTNITLAQSVSVTGDWNYAVPSTDITEAGIDFSGTYESSANQAYFDIEYNRKWDVSVHMIEIDWNNTFILSVRRTGDGFGQKKVTRGINYQQITNRSNKFFSGHKDRFSIPIQYKLEMVSVTIPAHTYIAEIVYTLRAK